MKIINKSLLAVALFFLTGAASAEKPNVWFTGSGQGFTEYLITNGDVKVNISCNYASMPSFDHGIFITRYNPKTKTDEEIFTFRDNTGDGEFIIDGISYFPSSPTDNKFSSGEWRRFTEAMSAAKKFELKIKDKTIGIFTPQGKSIREVASEMKDCKDMITLRNSIFKE